MDGSSCITDDRARLLEITASSLPALGRALGEAYRGRFAAGMARSVKHYSETKPVTLDSKRWGQLAASARAGARLCCPRAWPFLEGLSAGLGQDVFMGLLDFEVYMMEASPPLKTSPSRPVHPCTMTRKT